MSRKISKMTSLNGPFCIFDPWTFQSGGQNQRLLHARNKKNLFSSFITLMEKITSLVFEKDESENREISILWVLLAVFVNQNSKFDVRDKLHALRKQTVGVKKLFNDNLVEKWNKADVIRVRTLRHVRTSRTFCHLWFVSTPLHGWKRFRSEYSNKRTILYVETLKKEIDSIFFGERRLRKRRLHKINTAGVIGLQLLQCKNGIESFQTRYSSKCRFFDCDLGGIN